MKAVTKIQKDREAGVQRARRKEMVGEHGKEVSEGAVAPVEERTLERSWDVFPKRGREENSVLAR